MNKEVFPDIYSSFFHEMDQIQSINSGAQKAFDVLADPLHIGRVTVDFAPMKNAPASALKNLPEKLTLYRSAYSLNEDVRLNYQFSMKEHLIVQICVTADSRCEQWSGRQLQMMALVAETTFLFVSRLRIAQVSELNASTDFLTGLNNTMSFTAAGASHCAVGDIGKYTIISFDIKNFRLVNQRYTNIIGDQVLRKFGLYISSILRTGEAACRMGGNTFIVLVFDENAGSVIEKLQTVEITAINSDASEIKVELSSRMAVYEIPDDEKDFGCILEAVSNTLTASRSMTHKSISYYSPQIINTINKKAEIQSMLPGALRNHEFLAYYQPKVSLDDYSLIGCEALVRWKHGDRFIMPGDFIPVLEEDGTVTQVDFYMLRQVCLDINDWLEKGYNPPLVSVNFSKHHLEDLNFVDEIMDILNQYHVDPSYIEIELTETTNFGDFARLKECVRRMQELGLTTSIDDFGTGYSSLNLLKDLSVDIIKIDKSLLSSGSSSYERDKIVIRNIIRMAHELGIDIITEGVETREQALLLREINCMMAQGYLFDRPLPKKDFEERMEVGQYFESETM